jgi:hypothetical protein
MNSRIGYSIAALILIAVTFQLFFRYEYVRQSAGLTWRVDRLTGASCTLPCEQTPAPNADLTKARYDEAADNIKQRAIALAKPNAGLLTYQHPDYTWRTEGIDWEPAEPTADDKPDPVRLVCYCSAKGIGWRWEVHTDTYAVYSVNDNADLMKKYGINAK